MNSPSPGSAHVIAVGTAWSSTNRYACGCARLAKTLPRLVIVALTRTPSAGCASKPSRVTFARTCRVTAFVDETTLDDGTDGRIRRDEECPFVNLTARARVLLM